MKIGTCGTMEKMNVVWVVGDRIIVQGTGVAIYTSTRDKAEALDICRRNLANFKED